MKWLLRAMLVVLIATPAFGQQTGNIVGKVTMADGSTLPGVSIQATSSVLPQPRNTASGSNGEYKLPLLPPGKYQVTFSLSGMATGEAHGRRRPAPGHHPQRVPRARNAHGRGHGRRAGHHARHRVVRAQGRGDRLGDQGPAGRPGLPRPREARPRRPVHRGWHARTERRRQRPGQHVRLRRRERDPAAVRHALGRAVVARHRAGRDREGGRRRDGLQPVRRHLDQHRQPVRDERLPRQPLLPDPAREHGRHARDDQRLRVRRGQELGDRQHRRSDRQGPALLLRVLLPPREHAREPGQSLRGCPGRLQELAKRVLRQAHVLADLLDPPQRLVPDLGPRAAEQRVGRGLCRLDEQRLRGEAEDRDPRGLLDHQRPQLRDGQVHRLQEPERGQTGQRAFPRAGARRKRQHQPPGARHDGARVHPRADRRPDGLQRLHRPHHQPLRVRPGRRQQGRRRRGRRVAVRQRRLLPPELPARLRRLVRQEGAAQPARRLPVLQGPGGPVPDLERVGLGLDARRPPQLPDEQLVRRADVLLLRGSRAAAGHPRRAHHQLPVRVAQHRAERLDPVGQRHRERRPPDEQRRALRPGPEGEGRHRLGVRGRARGTST